MAYIYDSSTRTYRSTSTTATKAASNVTRVSAKVYSKLGSQVAPTSSFYQSATRVSISSQAQTKLASGVKTSLQDALNIGAKGGSIPDATIELSGGFASLAAVEDKPNDLARARLLSMASSNAYGGTIKSFRLPSGTSATLDLATATKIGSTLLKKVDGNFSLELTPSELANADNLTTFADLRNAIGDRLSKFTIPGAETSASVSAGAVRALGPAVWAKYGGSLTVSDTIESVTQNNTWNDLRVLNNYRNFSFSVPDGIPAGTPATTDLKKFDFRLDYSSFISGYSLLKSMSRQPVGVSFTSGPSNTSQTQSVSVAGKLLNRDQFKVELAPVGGAAVTIPLSPLTFPPSTPTQERVNLLAKAVDDAIKKDGRFGGVTVSAENNVIRLNAAAPAFSGSMKLSLMERGENDTTNFIDVTNVPIYGLPSLANLTEIRSIAVTTSFDGLRSNWDSLTAFNTKTPLASITIPGSGDLLLTAQETQKYMPIIEKIADRQIIISDAPYAISSYANFTDDAAQKLATSVDLTGSVADLVKGAAGIAALSKAGKLRSMTLTDAGTSIISLPSEAAILLGDSLSKLNTSAKIQITDRPSLEQALKLADLSIPSNSNSFNLVGSFTIDTDGFNITRQNLHVLSAIISKISGISITGKTTLAKILDVVDMSFKVSRPVEINDSAIAIADIVSNRSEGFSDTALSAISSISANGSLPLADAGLVNNSKLSTKLLSGLQVSGISADFAGDLSPSNISDQKSILLALKAKGRLRAISTTDAAPASLLTALDANGLRVFLK